VNNIRVSGVEYEYSPAGRRIVDRPRKRWTGHYMRRRRKPGLAYSVTSAAAVDDDDDDKSLMTTRLKLSRN
jgi:hypothetical protein